MRKIICRFPNKKYLMALSKSLGIDLSRCLEFDLDKMVNLKFMQFSKPLNHTPKQDKHQCKKYYVGMPEFLNREIEEYHKITFHSSKSNEELSKIFRQPITDKTKSIWIPKLVPGKNSKLRVVGGNKDKKYPMYVVSKGRADICFTSIYLSRMEVEHYVVVEPQEIKEYAKHINNPYATLLELDLSYKDRYDTFDDLGDTKSKGPGAARNFAWDHSMKNGYEFHWVMDDNCNEGFHWFYQNNKVKCRSGAYFRAIEDFVDRFDNIAIGGLNYTKFCLESGKLPPYNLNTRIYSFLLIRNDIPYRWRGRYNEDTDLSLRVLIDNWCTIQFNCFVAGKATTQKLKGGNTKEFYAEEGTLNKSKMLEEMHPKYAKVVWKFNRWHHYVDYSSFNQKLRLKSNIDLSTFPKVNDYGMKIIMTNEDNTNNTKAELEERYIHLLVDHTQPQLNEYVDKKPKSPLFKKLKK